MRIFLIICLVSGLASSEKLDRSYLPPPGSKFSGGSPGDIETPLEFPKHSTGQQQGNGKPEIELGINRRPAPPMGTPDSQKPGFNYFQKSYPAPKTTTSYAITQTTTFPPDDEYAGIGQPSTFLNGSTVQSGFPGQDQPIRGSGQGSYNQYQPGQSQTAIITPYGTTARPQFPGVFNGPEYLPPVSNKQSPAQVLSNQDGFGYPSGLPQGPKYQDGPAISANHPGYVPQQNQYVGNLNVPSTASPQRQGGQFVPTGPGSQQTQNQFTGNQFPSSTAVPQYQDSQRFTPGFNQQNQFTESQLPSSTAAPQYQDGQRLITPGSNQQDQFSSNQKFPSSTVSPQSHFGQRFTTPKLNQQVFGERVPNQPKQFAGNQYTGSQNFPSSTAASTTGSIEQSQFTENQNFPSTAAPNYQDGHRFTTPGQIQSLFPDQPGFGSPVPSQYQNQFVGQNFQTSTSAPQFQDGTRLATPGYVQEGYGSSVVTQQNQYPGNQNYPSSTTAPQYQNGQQFTTPGPIGNQNFPSTSAPGYQGGQRFTTPGQFLDQQKIRSRIPGQHSQSQSTNDENYPSSTAAPQYQDSQRYSTPGSQQTFGSQQNQYGNQNFPTSTAAPQYQGQRITTPGQYFNQPNYPGSTTVPQYQQAFVPSSGTNQQGLHSQQDQYQRPVFNEQFPSSTITPQGFIPGSQPQYGINNIPIHGTKGAFPGPQGESQKYGDIHQPTSQTNFDFKPGFGTIGGGRAERPQAGGDRNAEILSYETELTPDGYFYTYDTSNGIHADETGTVGNGTRAQGGFSYTGDDGKVYSVVYSADENGFQPRGDHLPTPPPIPEAIQRVIDQANRDAESGINDDGSYNEEKYGYMKYEGPSSRLKPQNRPVSVDNVNIPVSTENRVGGHTKKTLKTKGRKPPNTGNSEELGSDYEETETDEMKNVNEKNRSVDDNLDSNEKNRLSAKRPKPIKNQAVVDNRSDKLKGIKMLLKPTMNLNTGIEGNGSDGRSTLYQENDESPSDDTTEESEDNDDLQESQDQVNYKDDPNHRTDFHGLNKYLPESKKTSRKNQSAKKRPNVRLNGTKQSIGVYDTERPEDRNSQGSGDSRPPFVDGSRIPSRIPPRKNKTGQRVKDLSNVTGQIMPQDSDDETKSYSDDGSDTVEEDGSDDASKPIANKSRISQLRKKISGKSKRPVNERKDISDDKEIKPSYDEDNGYEYTPPQRKFGSEDAIKLPSRINQGAQATLRPFMTKNVHGDEDEPSDYSGEYDAEKTDRGRPMAAQKQYPGYNQGGDNHNQNKPQVNDDEIFSTTRRPVSYGTSRPSGRPQFTGTSYNQNNPEVNEDVRFSTTRRPASYGTSRPFGRTQTTAIPQYQEQGMTGQVYNEPTIQSQRPGDKLSYNTNAPNRRIGDNVFSATTPLPPGSGSRYQRPSYQNRPTNGPYYDTKSPGEMYSAKTPSDQLPSTTYRPNYSFGDKNSPVTVGSGPIQSTNAPAFDRTMRPTYPSIRPSETETRPADQFRPTEGRFGVTSTQGMPGYQSTSAPIGEDFSGPKQTQRFDPKTGYHYK